MMETKLSTSRNHSANISRIKGAALLKQEKAREKQLKKTSITTLIQHGPFRNITFDAFLQIILELSMG
jgi:hypothetical protein